MIRTGKQKNRHMAVFLFRDEGAWQYYDQISAQTPESGLRYFSGSN